MSSAQQTTITNVEAPNIHRENLLSWERKKNRTGNSFMKKKEPNTAITPTSLKGSTDIADSRIYIATGRITRQTLDDVNQSQLNDCVNKRWHSWRRWRAVRYYRGHEQGGNEYAYIGSRRQNLVVDSESLFYPTDRGIWKTTTKLAAYLN